MPLHTPPPWRVVEHDDEAFILNEGESAPQGICSIRLANCGMNRSEALANAHFIVLACNSYVELLEALQKLYATHPGTCRPDHTWKGPEGEALKMARRIIARLDDESQIHDEEKKVSGDFKKQ